MTDTRSSSPDPSGTVGMAIGQEVRFAVVMYGGISLAIYINGVAQELLQLVRATAPDPGDHTQPYNRTVEGTAAVYRKLGQLLGRKGFDADQPWSENDPIRTRFVVDILSGTSAGGINGIYLAKALANGQSMDQLQSLWIDNGDIAMLLNDGHKLKPKFRQDPPQSLLSGWYMYDELLKAFEGMSEQQAAPRSPYVDDLDLFVTTTDIRGLPFPLRLWDKVADERRHRNVFRFRYRDGQTADRRNDFEKQYDALLAFAARCTSAFPYAFEPVRASDAVDHDRRPLFANVKAGAAHPWDEFFPMYQAPPGTPPQRESEFRWTERSFGDGGYLDNKPFSYAIDTLASRRATVPVDRKLLYVEPDPEQLDWMPDQDRDKPNVIENVNAALSLARYETIREDLQRILERNALIERVQRILAGMEDDVSPQARMATDLPSATFRVITLREQIAARGASYGGYHRLKVASVSDDLTEMIALVAGFDADSDLFDAIRHLVRTWRKLHYHENLQPTESEFLVRFDLGYRLRRLDFVLGKIDELFCLDDQTAALLQRWGETLPDGHEQRAAFRSELSRLCTPLSEAHRSLRRARTSIRRDEAVRAAIAHTGLDVDALRRILNAENDTVRMALLSEMMKQPPLRDAFKALDEAVSEYIAKETRSAALSCEAALDPPGAPADSSAGTATARRIVRAYYANFEHYDLIAFPILYETGVGNEMDPIEVVRVSPQDATVNPIGDRKLGGTAYGHFGAFLKDGWRRNDILWGRLHGAERLITVLLRGTDHPDSLREQLIQEAHVAILRETFDRADRDELCGLLVDALNATAKNGAAPKALYELAMKDSGTPQSERVLAALRSCLTPDQLYDFFRTSYEVDPDVDRQMMTKTVGRATRITGKILSDIATRAQLPSSPAVWLARVGTGITALLELAVPSGVVGDIGRRLLALIVFIELFLIAGAWLSNNEPVERFAVGALLVTGIAWLATYLLGDFVRRQQRRRRLARAAAAVFALILLVLAGIGILHVGDHATSVAHWLKLQTRPVASAIASTSPP